MRYVKLESTAQLSKRIPLQRTSAQQETVDSLLTFPLTGFDLCTMPPLSQENLYPPFLPVF